MISVLCPTRKRIESLTRMVISCQETATTPIEILLCIDDDDGDTQACAERLGLKAMVGKRDPVMTRYWNYLLPLASGDILMQANDDIIFRTPGWSAIVEDAYAQSQDKILLVHGSDEGVHFDKFGPHPFLHRRWVDAIGYFIPPYFPSDYGDNWINEIADNLGRRRYLPFIVEHMHFKFGKSLLDGVYQDRLDRHDDGVDASWWATQYLRWIDCLKLIALMEPSEELMVKKAVIERCLSHCPFCGKHSFKEIDGRRQCDECRGRWL